MRSRSLSLFAAALLMGGLIYGLIALFGLRHQQGDSYPRYSTLRTDPVGAKAIYQAFDALTEVKASQNFRPLPQLKPTAPVALMYLGVPRPAYWQSRELEVFHGLVAHGSTAVFTFLPATPASIRESGGGDQKEGEESPVRKKKNAKGKKDAKEENEESTPGVAFDQAAEQWGVKFGVLTTKEMPEEKFATRVEEGVLESDLPWRSALYFDELSAPWRVIYKYAGRPVVIERRWGDGRIVMIADSFLLSNEALDGELRRPEFISWLVGSHRTVVFDEEHHGISEGGGMTSLIRHYRLQGFLAGFAVFLVLLLWKSGLRFVPPHGEKVGDNVLIGGRESTEGFVSLLRRSVAPGEILDTCVREWRKSFEHQPAQARKMEVALEQAAAEKGPVARYRKIAQALR